MAFNGILQLLLLDADVALCHGSAAVLQELLDHPELLNSDPYGNWLIKVEQVTDTEELLDAAAYEAFCAQEG